MLFYYPNSRTSAVTCSGMVTFGSITKIVRQLPIGLLYVVRKISSARTPRSQLCSLMPTMEK